MTRGQSLTIVPAASPKVKPNMQVTENPDQVLPRNPSTAAGAQESLTSFQKQVAKGYKHDSSWFDKLTAAEQSKCQSRQGLWWHEDALVIPDYRDLRLQCLRELHNCPYSGHLGVTKTQKAVSRLYWWKGLFEDVRKHIRTCSVCQKSKNSSQKSARLLQPLQIPGRRWESISVDMIVQLPLTKSGNTKIVVFVNRLSKMVHFAAVPRGFGDEDMARLLMHTIFKLHGLPREIVSDRDTMFTSEFWEVLTTSTSKINRLPSP